MRIARAWLWAAGTLALAGCSRYDLNAALGTPKNPHPVFADPHKAKGKPPSQEAIIRPLYETLLTANAGDGKGLNTPGDKDVDAVMRRYIAAGFALSDLYCGNFFEKTDEAYRRRRFGRTLTNDVGTAVSTILGLANAGENIVTGVAAGVGLADSTWRNYDDSFVISPDLSNVQALVFAAQDNFRATTFKSNESIPKDYASAQTVIRRYANFCSFLGMKALLDQSSGQQRTQLNSQTDEITRPKKPETSQPNKDGGPGIQGGARAQGETSAPAVPAPAGSQPLAYPVTAQPVIAPNAPVPR